MNTRLSIAALMAAIFAVLSSSMVFAHCQIPCGIYDDNARVVEMLEDVATIEKAVQQINSLAGKTDPQSLNQQVRWVTNKELHAQRIIETISNYFLTQRVKPAQSDYMERLKKHHLVILLSMANKQQVDVASVQRLKTAVAALEAYYPHTH